MCEDLRVSVDPNAAPLLASWLRPGEHLVWAGRPDPSVRFTAADRALIPFSVLWFGFAVFWEASAVATGAPVFFLLFGAVFVLVGLFITVGRFPAKAWRKNRAIVVEGNSMMDSPLGSVATSVRRHRDGRHVSVTFGSQVPWSHGGMYANTGLDFFIQGERGVAFFDVADGDGLLTAMENR